MPKERSFRIPINKSGKFRLVGSGALLAGCSVWTLLALFFLQRPEWVPKCVFRGLTGYDCPACGALRMVDRAAHGLWEEAFFCNPYLAVVAPYLLASLYAVLRKDRVARVLRRVTVHPVVVGFFVALMIGWWVFRNTSVWREFLGDYGASV